MQSRLQRRPFPDSNRANARCGHTSCRARSKCALGRANEQRSCHYGTRPRGALAMRDPSIWSDSIFPVLRKLQQWGYLRIEVEGLQNIPQNRPFVMVANHGGWFALDGL